MSILVTGGIGYIGSHTVVDLLNNNEDVIVVDNLSNSSESVISKIKEITNKDFKFYKVDILDEQKLDEIFNENHINSVIHFAGLKAVGESVTKPLEYYTNNISGTLTLLRIMRKHNCKKIVFSSSATVYGCPEVPKYREEMGRGKTTNPYGTTKAMIEKILEDLYVSDNTWNIVILRYFNPIGAHKSGLIGDNPNGIPNNLMPYIQKVAVGQLKELAVFGNDYNTVDGTGVRDYIHVLDLSNGHIKALEFINKTDNGIEIFNLGTGSGTSVLELINAFEKENNVKVPYKIVERRPGDIAVCYADPSKANKLLDWKANRTINEMCKDSWNYIKKEN